MDSVTVPVAALAVSALVATTLALTRLRGALLTPPLVLVGIFGPAIGIAGLIFGSTGLFVALIVIGALTTILWSVLAWGRDVEGHESLSPKLIPVSDALTPMLLPLGVLTVAVGTLALVATKASGWWSNEVLLVAVVGFAGFVGSSAAAVTDIADRYGDAMPDKVGKVINWRPSARARAEVVIDVPVEDVFKFVASLENLQHWLSDDTGVAPLSRTPVGAGTIYRQAEDGNEIKLEVTEAAPNRRFAYKRHSYRRSDDRYLLSTNSYDFAKCSDAATRVTLTQVQRLGIEFLAYKFPYTILVLPLLIWSMRRSLRMQATDLRRRMEGRPDNASS